MLNQSATPARPRNERHFCAGREFASGSDCGSVSLQSGVETWERGLVHSPAFNGVAVLSQTGVDGINAPCTGKLVEDRIGFHLFCCGHM